MSKGLEKGPGHEKNFKGGDNVKEHISVIRFANFPPVSIQIEIFKVIPLFVTTAWSFRHFEGKPLDHKIVKRLRCTDTWMMLKYK